MKNRTLQDKLRSMDDGELNLAYQECFKSPSGQLVLEDLKNRCCSFVPCASEFDEGARRVILSIESRIQPETKGEENV